MVSGSDTRGASAPDRSRSNLPAAVARQAQARARDIRRVSADLPREDRPGIDEDAHGRKGRARRPVGIGKAHVAELDHRRAPALGQIERHLADLDPARRHGGVQTRLDPVMQRLGQGHRRDVEPQPEPTGQRPEEEG
jgi:hypothetical protein